MGKGNRARKRVKATGKRKSAEKKAKCYPSEEMDEADAAAAGTNTGHTASDLVAASRACTPPSERKRRPRRSASANAAAGKRGRRRQLRRHVDGDATGSEAVQENTARQEEIDSDEDLPESSLNGGGDTGSHETKEFNEGQVVWAKVRRYPHWPALVVKAAKKRFISVNFFAYDGPSHTFKNPRKNVIPYNNDHKEYREGYQLSTQSEHEQEAFKNAVAFADSFIRKQALPNSEVSTEQKKEFEYIMEFRSPKNFRPSNPDTGSARMSAFCNYQLQYEETEGIRNRSSEDEDKEDEDEVSEEDKLIELEKSLVITPTQPQYNDENYVLQFVSKLEAELHKIFNREAKSDRHTDFCSPRAAVRNQLKRRSGFGPIQNEDLQEKMANKLLQIVRGFKPPEHMSPNNYVFEVMLPEAIIRLIEDVEKTSHREARDIYESHITGQT